MSARKHWLLASLILFLLMLFVPFLAHFY